MDYPALKIRYIADDSGVQDSNYHPRVTGDDVPGSRKLGCSQTPLPIPLRIIGNALDGTGGVGLRRADVRVAPQSSQEGVQPFRPHLASQGEDLNLQTGNRPRPLQPDPVQVNSLLHLRRSGLQAHQNTRPLNSDHLLSLIHISEPTRLRRISYA